MPSHSATLGEIARANPSSTRIFLRHRLDFCCKGHRTLAEACGDAGLDTARVADEIEQAGHLRPEASWDSRPLAELADHIEARYHLALRRDLPPLITAARKVERVHAAKPDVPAGLADLLTELFDEMQDHMAKEEGVLFPRIRHGVAVAGPVQMMELEHEAHGERLAAIRRLTGDLRPPVHACATWTALYRALEELEAELMQHIHLENHVLFPRAVQAGTPVVRVDAGRGA